MIFKTLAILVLFIFMPLMVFAQKLGITDRLGGTYVVSFTVPEGEVKVFLPDDMSGGDTVSAAVFPYPKPGSGAVLNSYNIHTGIKSVPVSSGIVTLEIPRNMSGSSLRVTLRDSENREISYSTAAVKLPDAFADRPETPTPFDFETPLVGQSGRLAQIKGPFDGDFSTTSLSIGGSPAYIISESPRKLVFEVPSGLPGQAEVVLVEQTLTVKRPFTALRVVKIGENEGSAPASIVPSGYSARQGTSPVSVNQAASTEIIKEDIVSEVANEKVVVAEESSTQKTALIEEELEINTTEVQTGQEVSVPVQKPEPSANIDVAQVLQAQLSLPLQGGASLVVSEQVDEVVVRELDVTQESGSGKEIEMKSLEADLIEEEIVVEENLDVTSASKTTGAQDASESSKDLIESIYRSTTGDIQESPKQPSKPTKTTTSVKTPDKTSSGKSGMYTVQVASFRDRASADSLAKNLERKGYNTMVTEADVPGKGRWSRVSVGSFDTKQQAKAYGERLKTKERSIKSIYITVIK